MKLRWFYSRTLRQASAMRRHVRKLARSQRDIISPQALDAIHAPTEELSQAIEQNADNATLIKKMEVVGKAANKWLKPYPHAAWRENIEVLLVALVVAMGIRTFFLQPFKIPTGSMQPTLYGLVPPPGSGSQPDMRMPNRAVRFFDFWIRDNSYYHEVAPADGQLLAVRQPVRFLLFNLKQSYLFNDQWRTIWWPKDLLFERAGYRIEPHSGRVVNSRVFQQGEDILRLVVKSGDHLFVNRLTYNFRPPRRGEIIVFETRGIFGLQQDEYYIKRLVALGSERVRIGNDRHLRINEVRLDASTPFFENIYAFDPREPPHDSRYSGHVNQHVANQFGMQGLARLFRDGETEFLMPPHHYMVMGDNTVNSRDSRDFGAFSRTNVIGKASFVYWPITDRFGFGYR